PPVSTLFPYTTLFRSLERRTQEVRDRNARDLHRVLEREEDPRARTLVRLHLQEVLSLVQHAAARDLVRRVPGEHLGQRALPRTRSEEHTSELQSRENL